MNNNVFYALNELCYEIFLKLYKLFSPKPTFTMIMEYLDDKHPHLT